MARKPSVTDEGNRGAGIERVIMYRHLLLLNFRIAEFLTPVVNASDLNPPARLHLRRPLRSRGQGAHQKALVVNEQSRQPIPCLLQPQPVSFSRTVSEGRMVSRVINRVEILA